MRSHGEEQDSIVCSPFASPLRYIKRTRFVGKYCCQFSHRSRGQSLRHKQRKREKVPIRIRTVCKQPRAESIIVSS